MKDKKYYTKKFGSKIVELAREFYETDSCKVLFSEDCKYEDDCPASDDIVEEYIFKAFHKIK